MTAAYLAFHVATGCLFATVLVLLVIVCLWRTAATKRIDNGHKEEDAQPNSSLELANSKCTQPKKDNEYQDGTPVAKKEAKRTDPREASHVYDIPRSSAKLDDDVADPRGIDEGPSVVYDIPKPQSVDPLAAYDVPRSLQLKDTDQDYENIDNCLPDTKRELDDDATYENVSPILQAKLLEAHIPHYQSPRKVSPISEKFGSCDKLLKSPSSMQ